MRSRMCVCQCCYQIIIEYYYYMLFVCIVILIDVVVVVVCFVFFLCFFCFFFQAEDGIRDLVRSRGLGDVYKRQVISPSPVT